MLSHLSRKDETRGRTRSSVGTVTHSWRGTSWESIWQDAPVGSSGGVESNNRSGHLGPWTPLGAGLPTPQAACLGVRHPYSKGTQEYVRPYFWRPVERDWQDRKFLILFAQP
jgi:hypothetical protein